MVIKQSALAQISASRSSEYKKSFRWIKTKGEKSGIYVLGQLAYQFEKGTFSLFQKLKH